MKTVNKSVLIWYTPREMYDLVVDVDKYSKFLPWCEKARVVETLESGMVAEIGISFGGIKQTFTTRNNHVEASQVHMQLMKGPFSDLNGRWDFHPLGDGSQRACKVELALNYGFDNAALAKVVGPVFDKIAASMVDAFVKRAQQVYGE